MASFSWNATSVMNYVNSSASGTTSTTKDWTGTVYQNRLNTITDAVVEYRLLKLVSGSYQSTSFVDTVSGDGTFKLFFNNVGPGTYKMRITNVGGGTIESEGSVTF